VGKNLFSIGAIKVDQKDLITRNEDVLELKVCVKETCLVESPEQKAGRSDGFSLERKDFPGGAGANFLKITNQVLGQRDFQGEKIGPIKERRYISMNGAQRLNRRDAGRTNLFKEGQLPKRPRSEKKEIPREAPEEASVRVAANDHPFIRPKRDAGMRSSSLKVFRGRLLLFEEGLHVFDSLPKEEVLIVVFDKEMNSALSDE
jgi:hypothetical protein